MHHTHRSLAYVMLIIVIVVLPTVAALGWYQVTRDPYFRPLGITREALRAYGVPGVGAEVVAYIDWPAAHAGHAARKQLAEDLAASFASKGVDVQLVFRDGTGSTRITYAIGNSVIGPYSTARAAEGVAAAVEAYRMNRARR